MDLELTYIYLRIIWLLFLCLTKKKQFRSSHVGYLYYFHVFLLKAEIKPGSNISRVCLQ